MKPIRIFRHLACEGPGYLGTFFDKNDTPYEVVCIDEGIDVPVSLDDVSGLVFMGGSMSVNDSLSWIEKEMELIRQAVTKGVPVMGVCLGGQLMAKALGGEVTRGPSLETGWHAVEVVEAETDSDWVSDLPSTFTAFHWHGDTFSIPEGASLILGSQCCDHQAFVLGDHLAMQFHLEMMEDMVKEWSDLYASDLEKLSGCVQSAEQMTKGLTEKIADLHKVADILLGEWLKRIKKRL